MATAYWRALLDAKWSDLVDGGANDTWWDSETGGAPTGALPGMGDQVVIVGPGKCLPSDNTFDFCAGITVRTTGHIDSIDRVLGVFFPVDDEPVKIEGAGIFRAGVVPIITSDALRSYKIPTFNSPVIGEDGFGIMYFGGYNNTVKLARNVAADNVNYITAAVALAIFPTPSSEAEAAVVDANGFNVDADNVNAATWGKWLLGSGNHRLGGIKMYDDISDPYPAWVYLGSSTITMKNPVFDTGLVNPQLSATPVKKIIPGTSKIIVPTGISLFVTGINQLYDLEVNGTFNPTDSNITVNNISGNGLLSWGSPRTIFYRGTNTFTGTFNNVTLKKPSSGRSSLSIGSQLTVEV